MKFWNRIKIQTGIRGRGKTYIRPLFISKNSPTNYFGSGASGEGRKIGIVASAAAFCRDLWLILFTAISHMKVQYVLFKVL